MRRDGLTHRQIAIAGFSQGAAVAALAALTYGQPLAGVALLSGWLLPAARERRRAADGALAAANAELRAREVGCAVLVAEVGRGQ